MSLIMFSRNRFLVGGGWGTPSPLSENLPKSFPPRLDPHTTNHENLRKFSTLLVHQDILLTKKSPPIMCCPNGLPTTWCPSNVLEGKGRAIFWKSPPLK